MRRTTALLTGFLALTFLLLPAAQAKTIADARAEVVRTTMRYLNVPYLWGGMHPGTGMDCSAFVKLVYESADLHLPRVAREQYSSSLYLKPAGVLPGDLLFFSMKKPGGATPDHVGIYVGKGYFVHAGVSTGVHIDAVSNPFFYSRLISARKYRGF